MTASAVLLESIGKRYALGRDEAVYGRLTESISQSVRNIFGPPRVGREASRGEFWALKDVTFDVPHGEVFGIVGRNGAGKSTLLKILSRITAPTIGRALLDGRVGSLLEVGTGFHPELTGRENIYLSGAILGMRRAEISRVFEDIVDFAGVAEFIDVPVKRYSSGMQVRLGFAVAASLESEILIIDEVLAVGDAEFQKRCLARIESAAHSGRTVLFVSHNLPAVETLCTGAVLLKAGRVATIGSPADVIRAYVDGIETSAAIDVRLREDRQGDGRLRVTSIQSSVRTGAPSEIRIAYAGDADLRNVQISAGLFTLRGEGAAYLANEMSGDIWGSAPASGEFVCRFDRAPLLPGRYTMSVYCTVSGMLADWVLDAAIVDVTPGDYFGTGRLPPPSYGSVAASHAWSIEALS